ncbi:hypothetical protein FRC01_006225 [Tulasnella sp. 417]|nr:hypothetical protein FRC01_006225 [Tulasnella sp. 417]
MTSPIPTNDQNAPSDPNGAPEATTVEPNGKAAEPANPSSVVSPPRAASPSSRYSALADEENPYTQIIESLRAQNNELFGQVTQLNSKLVQSYDRVSDLEDADHLTQAALRNANLRVAQLEMERMEHLSALDTGLLVERAHVTQELSRLMEKVSEESAQRGLAETAKHNIEKDLDDLSASLFNQANTMVAEARFARAQSEKKAASAETAMKGAEEAVALMQSQMQSLTEAREKAEHEAEALRELVSKSGVGERRIRTTSLISSGSQASLVAIPKLIKGHAPYEEFIAFVTHLRSLRPAAQQPPALSSIISLPFLARLIAEDSDPTLRLDLAPSLNWLTRRNIAGAVQQGQLTVEPMQSGHLLMELATHSLAGMQPTEVACALCGKHVLNITDTTAPPPSHPTTNSIRPALQNTAAVWASTSRFLRSSLSSNSSAPNSRSTTMPPSPSTPSTVIYAFRLSLPAPQKSQPYALCSSGWCLTRLRATCELWRFVRTSVIDKVWDGEAQAQSTVSASGSSSSVSQSTTFAGYSLPPVPPRRKTGMTMGGLFGKGLGALGMDVSGGQQQASSNDTSTASTMARHQTAPAAINTPTPTATPSPAVQNAAAPPPPPPRRLPPPPAPPPRSTSRPNITASPTKEPVPLAASSPVDKEEDEGFVTPRTSLDKPNTPKDAVNGPVATDGAVVLNEEPTPLPEKKPEQPVKAGPTTPARPPRASSPARRPGTPSSTTLPPSTPTTPVKEPVQLPSPASTPNAATASPSAPPPLPRRAASRKVLPNRSPRTSMLIMGKEKDTFGEKERRNSISQLMADVAPEVRRASLDGKPLSRPGTPSNDRPASPALARPASPSPARPASPLRTLKRSSLSAAPAEISPLTTSPAEEKPVAEKPVAEQPAAEKPVAEKPVEPTAEKTAPPPLPPREHDAPPVPSKQLDGDLDGKVFEDDDRVTVTDRTWEDRVWKELTRLKLEMFWARVGGVQVPSS